ncbi:hypothetical protein FH07_18965 [Escherichia coli]|nr:hypothetical protein FH07_18965 [Escherichia coli]
MFESFHDFSNHGNLLALQGLYGNHATPLQTHDDRQEWVHRSALQIAHSLITPVMKKYHHVGSQDKHRVALITRFGSEIFR